jgi:hypothetical protein
LKKQSFQFWKTPEKQETTKVRNIIGIIDIMGIIDIIYWHNLYNWYNILICT